VQVYRMILDDSGRSSALSSNVCVRVTTEGLTAEDIDLAAS
jgi:hypothetical protein